MDQVFQMTVFTACTNYSSVNSKRLLKKQKPRYTIKPKNSKEKRDSCSTTLKIYGTFISKTVIDLFFNLGLCLSYDRILEFTKKLSDAQIENYELIGVFFLTH